MPSTPPPPIDPSSLFTDPLLGATQSGAPAVDFIANSCTLTVFISNVVVFGVRSILIIMIVYNVAKGIQKVAMGDSKEDFDTLRSSITNAVISAFGVILVVSSFFIPCAFLRLLGVPDSENIFCNGFTCASTSASEIGDPQGGIK